MNMSENLEKANKQVVWIFFRSTAMDKDGTLNIQIVVTGILEITPEELIASLGNSASFGSLKKLLKEVDDIEVADVR